MCTDLCRCCQWRHYFTYSLTVKVYCFCLHHYVVIVVVIVTHDVVYVVNYTHGIQYRKIDLYVLIKSIFFVNRAALVLTTRLTITKRTIC